VLILFYTNKQSTELVQRLLLAPQAAVAAAIEAALLVQVTA